MSDHRCPDLGPPRVGANSEQMVCELQGSELPSAGISFKTETSLLQIRSTYLPVPLACPSSDAIYPIFYSRFFSCVGATAASLTFGFSLVFLELFVCFSVLRLPAGAEKGASCV